MRRATLVPLILAGMALAACSAAQPANYDPRDPCQRCPPGLFTGTDPGLRIEPRKANPPPRFSSFANQAQILLD